jgi:hypothetical protein
MDAMHERALADDIMWQGRKDMETLEHAFNGLLEAQQKFGWLTIPKEVYTELLGERLGGEWYAAQEERRSVELSKAA